MTDSRLGRQSSILQSPQCCRASCLPRAHGVSDPAAGTRARLTLSDLTHTNAERAIHGVVNSRDMLASGFTTIRDVGNDANYVATDLRRAIDQGLIPGPTIINSGRIIALGGSIFLIPNVASWARPSISLPIPATKCAKRFVRTSTSAPAS